MNPLYALKGDSVCVNMSEVAVFMERSVFCGELQQQYSEVEIFSEANWVSQDRPRPRPL